MEDIKTYGELKKAIKDIINKQKLEKVGSVSVDTIIGAIPVLGNIKSGLDFMNALVKAPDTQKTKTWIDKLQVDDQVSAIVDDTVESGFIKLIASSIEKEADNKPLESDFDMNAKLIDYLKGKFKGRSVSGIAESKKRKDILKEKIKEYVVKRLKKEITNPENPDGVLNIPKNNKTAIEKAKKDNKQFTTY
jgi:hypothetical protein